MMAASLAGARGRTLGPAKRPPSIFHLPLSTVSKSKAGGGGEPEARRDRHSPEMNSNQMVRNQQPIELNCANQTN